MQQKNSKLDFTGQDIYVGLDTDTVGEFHLEEL
jgi:hypothetical protein